MPSNSDQFCLEVDGTYEPFTYWVYGGQFISVTPENLPFATFYEPDTQRIIQLQNVEYYGRGRINSSKLRMVF